MKRAIVTVVLMVSAVLGLSPTQAAPQTVLADGLPRCCV
jgi:hypothetical protein